MAVNPRAALDRAAGRRNDRRSKRCGGLLFVCCAPKPPDAQGWDKVWRTNRLWSVFPPANARTQLPFPCIDRRSRCWESGGTDKHLRDDSRAWLDGSDAKAFVIPRDLLLPSPKLYAKVRETPAAKPLKVTDAIPIRKDSQFIRTCVSNNYRQVLRIRSG